MTLVGFSRSKDVSEDDAAYLMTFGPFLDLGADEILALKRQYADDPALQAEVNERAWPQVPWVVNKRRPLVQADFPEWARLNDSELHPLYEDWRGGRALSDDEVREAGYR